MATAAPKKNGQTTKGETTATEPVFGVQRVYLRDISFESPQAPLVFKEGNWNPEVKVDLATTPSKLTDKVHQVVLKLTITAKNEDKVAFLAEIEQAGIFTIENYDAEQMDLILGTVCPNIIFPYARETASDIIVRGGFPSIYLNPINFDALYAQQKAQKSETTGAGGEAANA